MTINKSKRLVLVELNELNFDLAAVYAKKYGFANLAKVIKSARITSSEVQYEELEPWIQWVSVHTGKTAAEHGVFRLGDIVQAEAQQVFEVVERAGYKVGAISPMNARNSLERPAYFVPDPWTRTTTDSTFWSRTLSKAISQAVNDNSDQKLKLQSVLSLLAGLFYFANPRNYLRYLKLALSSRSARWRKALFLDIFLHDVHIKLFKKTSAQFSTVFFNAGAHIQHHYLLNAREVVEPAVQNPSWYLDAKHDPFKEMLAEYDRILGDYLAMEKVDLIVATGLAQKPYDRVKYYWRLKDHVSFLEAIGLKCRRVLPRMTRDFLIEFDSSASAAEAEKILRSMLSVTDNISIFGEIENRGDSLFVTLTYGSDITDDFLVSIGNQKFDLKPHVVFVAIKNGMHVSKGHAYFKGDIERYAARPDQHVKSLYTAIVRYFGCSTESAEVLQASEENLRDDAVEYA
jgi:hypothetical protein